MFIRVERPLTWRETKVAGPRRVERLLMPSTGALAELVALDCARCKRPRQAKVGELVRYVRDGVLSCPWCGLALEMPARLREHLGAPAGPTARRVDGELWRESAPLAPRATDWKGLGLMIGVPLAAIALLVVAVAIWG